MDFALSEEQQLLRNSARDFLNAECPKSMVREIELSEAGHSVELWQKMAELGWMGLAFPEEYGGAGLGLLEMAVLFEEFGRAATPGPMFCTLVLGSLPISEWGTQEQKKALLPKVASGDLVLTMALSEPEVDSDSRFVATEAISQNGGFILTGTKLFVPYASVADYILIVARTDGLPGDEKGITVFIVDAKKPGISFTPLKTIAADKQFEVLMDSVSVSTNDVLGTLNAGLPVIQSILMKATAIQCAEMVGGAQQELEITAEYVKTRVQFERPIGSFQAVQHRMADMFIDTNGARWATYQAVWRLSKGMPASKEVAIAKVFTNAACQRVAFSAQQLHAGIGVDMDYDLQFYFRRAKAFELTMGGTPFQLETLGNTIL
ncbi:MAG: acyl-CoA/acyl-ACP dehydrogenase [Chloroflexi bacterium]|nr:acyl-CoA/acyl-ACP dehydrogenase [Chloroflexota bacterium]